MGTSIIHRRDGQALTRALTSPTRVFTMKVLTQATVEGGRCLTTTSMSLTRTRSTILKEGNTTTKVLTENTAITNYIIPVATTITTGHIVNRTTESMMCWIRIIMTCCHLNGKSNPVSTTSCIITTTTTIAVAHVLTTINSKSTTPPTTNSPANTGPVFSLHRR